MPTRQRSILLRRAAAALIAAAALSTAVPAAAQTAREQALEARVAELERLVQQLMAGQAKPAAAAPAATPAAAAPGAAPAGPAPIQSASILPNAAAGTSFVFTGFAKADALWTDTPDGEIPEQSAGRDYYVPGATPIGGLDEGTDFDAHVKQTRLILGTDTPLGGKDKLSTRFEVDFFGSITGDQRVTNTYAPVLRHAFVQWRSWLVGQTWSNFQDVAALPEAVDFIGPTDGTVFVRQPQVRYARGGLSLSLENPETTITPFRGGTGGNARIQTDDSTLPDLTARYTWKGAWGHLSLAGLVRELKYETTGAGAIDDSTVGAAASLSGKWMIGKDDVRFMLLGGNLGRYVGLNFTNDAVLTGAGGLETIDGFAGFVAYRHVFTDRLRTNLYYSIGTYDNDAALTGGGVNKQSQSFTANLIYSPLPKLDVGAEFRHAIRELENGAEGDLNRLQLTTKYSF